MILENYNVLKEQGVIATKTNKFEGETIMYSFHCYPPRKGTFLGPTFVKPACPPLIDVLYKSKQSEEQLYIVVTGGDIIYNDGRLIINLNGNKNIELKEEYVVDMYHDYDGYETETDEVYNAFQVNDYRDYMSLIDEITDFFGKNHPARHHYFPISKEDFLMCCNAASIDMIVKEDKHNIWKGWFDWGDLTFTQLQPIFRSLYNKAIDSSMFADAEKEASALFVVVEEAPKKKKKGLLGLFK